MNRKNQILCRVFQVLKDDDMLARLTKSGRLEDGYDVIEENLSDTTEDEYREAIKSIKENKGRIEINEEDGQLLEEDLERVSGGAIEFQKGF